MSIKKYTKKELKKLTDKTDWARVISTTQDMADRQSAEDKENPDLTRNKFKKSKKIK